MLARMAGLLSVVLLAIPAFGQTGQANVENPGALPDEFFGISYGFKRFAETLSLFFTFNEADRLTMRADFAERRLAEGILMAQKGDDRTAENLLQEYVDEMGKIVSATQFLVTSRPTDKKVKELISKVADATSRHLAVLKEVQSTVSEKVKPMIQLAISLGERQSLISGAAIQNIPLQERPAAPSVSDPAPIRRKGKT